MKVYLCMLPASENWLPHILTLSRILAEILFRSRG